MNWIGVSFELKDDQQNSANQEAFYNTLTTNYKADYGQFENVTNSLLAKIQPIVNAGPGQYGFDATQDAALRTSATSADAAATKNAQVAANQQITAANGGADLMPTGAAEELKQRADIAGAQKLSADQNTITNEGYAQGNENWKTALNSEGSTLSLMNPNSFAGSATSGGNAATGAIEAKTQAEDGWMSAVGGALGGVASVATAKLMK